MAEPLMTKPSPPLPMVGGDDAAVVALSDSVRKVAESAFSLELRGVGGVTDEIVQMARKLSKEIDAVVGRGQ